VALLVVGIQRVKLAPLGRNQLHEARHRHFRVLLEHHRPDLVGVELVARPLAEVLVRVVDVHVVEAVFRTHLVRRQLQVAPGKRCHNSQFSLLEPSFRPHRSTIDVAHCHRWSSAVCLSVGLSVMIVSPAKTAEPIEMPFGMWTWVDSRNHILDGVQIGLCDGTTGRKVASPGHGRQSTHSKGFNRGRTGTERMPIGVY